MPTICKGGGIIRLRLCYPFYCSSLCGFMGWNECLLSQSLAVILSVSILNLSLRCYLNMGMLSGLTIVVVTVVPGILSSLGLFMGNIIYGGL